MSQAIFELSSLNQSTGFTINGLAAGDEAGRTVTGIGDINNDGTPDMVVTTPIAEPFGLADAGQVYVIFGQTNFTSILELSSLNGSNGFIINGVKAGDWLATTAPSSGDINDDGVDDLVIGAWGADTSSVNAGRVYVIFGRTNFASTLDLSSLNGSNGFIINGHKSEEAGISTAIADVNDDDMPDIIIGAWAGDPDGRVNAGRVYIVFGKESFTSPIELSTLNGQNGLIVNGINAEDITGNAIATPDINNDGINDIVIGAWKADLGGRVETGRIYIVFGKASFTNPLELSTLDGENGFIINGINAGDRAGACISGAGDINYDGIPDLVIGSSVSSGQAYVIFGKESFTSPFELNSLDGNNGFIINIDEPGSHSLCASDAIGDVNGDGKDDIILGSELASALPDEHILFLAPQPLLIHLILAL